MQATQNNTLTIAKLEVKNSIKSKWFATYTSIFALILGALLVLGGKDGGLSRLLLSYIQICIVILPIFTLIISVRCLIGDKERFILEYMLSFPLSLKEYYFGKFLGRIFLILTPILFSLFLVLVAGLFLGVGILMFCYFTLMLSSLIIAFLGISFFISAVSQNSEKAIFTAFFIWLVLLVFIDILFIGFMLKSGISENVVFSLALLNPLQLFRIGSLSLFDPNLSVMGTTAYFVLDSFGRVGIAVFSIIYPLFLGLLFAFLGFFVFKNKDLI